MNIAIKLPSCICHNDSRVNRAEVKQGHGGGGRATPSFSKSHPCSEDFLHFYQRPPSVFHLIKWQRREGVPHQPDESQPKMILYIIS